MATDTFDADLSRKLCESMRDMLTREQVSMGHALTSLACACVALVGGTAASSDERTATLNVWRELVKFWTEKAAEIR